MLVVNREGKLFLGERAGEPGVWQFPQGGIEEKDSLEENVLRELNEELGAAKDKFKIIRKFEATHDYNFRNPPAYAKDKWRGQTQTFWLVEFLGDDKDLDLNAHEQEFMGFKWCTPSEVRRFTEPVRLPGYEAPLVEFEKCYK